MQPSLTHSHIEPTITQLKNEEYKTLGENSTFGLGSRVKKFDEIQP